MDESGLFQIDRFRVPTDGDEGPVAKKSKLSSVLAKARKRAEKRKNEDTETPEEVDEESSSSESEEEIEEMDVDEKSSVSEMQVDEDFKILENVAEKKREKINMELPKWCQSPTLIQPKLENLEKLKKIKPLVRPEIYKNLKEMGFKTLFPVQSVLTTKLLERGPKRDFAVQAPTGSGKTLAFLIPLVQSVLNRTIPYIRGMVVAPTRVLAEQIYKVLLELIRGTPLKARILTGSKQTNFQPTTRIGDREYSSFDMLVCTPGSLTGLSFDTGFELDFSRLKYLVIDEADQMEGEWLKTLEAKIPKQCQKLLFSATLASDPQFLAALKLKHPMLYSTGDQSSTPSGLREEKIVTELRLKPFVMKIIMKEYKKILIFTNKTETAEKLHLLLNKLGEETELLSSSLDHDWKRSNAIKKLQNGKLKCLVCSDVAARGLDIDDCDIVINYDLAPLEAIHIHRSGRTARAGSSGVCLTFTNSMEYEAMMKRIGRRFHKRRISKEIVEEARLLAQQNN